MTAPLSQDLRRRIVRAVEAGRSARQAAERFEVSPSAAIKLMRRVRQTGSPAPGQIGGHRRPLLEADADLILALVGGKTRILLYRLGLSHKKHGESRRAGPARRGPPPAALAGVAALHGP